jgi:hypothetical protein
MLKWDAAVFFHAFLLNKWGTKGINTLLLVMKWKNIFTPGLFWTACNKIATAQPVILWAIDNVPNVTKQWDKALAVYAALVTIFAAEISKIGLTLQVVLAVVVLLATMTDWVIKRYTPKIARYFARRLLTLIQQDKQQLLSFKRRLSSERELLAWVKQNYPSFGYLSIVRELRELSRELSDK